MKLSTMIVTAAAVVLAGCQTPAPTPYPNKVSATFVGLGYKCDKKDLRKKGSDIDIATMYESVKFAYRDYNEFQPRCTYRIIQDEDATVDNVKTALRQAMYDDLAIIYFSCKATQVAAVDDKEEVDGLDECLRLYDGLLKDNDIWEILQSAQGRVFIIFDTDNSETLFKNDNTEQKPILVDFRDEMLKGDRVNPLNLLCWSACADNETLKERSIGSKLTNTFYFKFSNEYLTYDEIFSKVYETLKNKQNIKKTVIGEDFSDRSMFR